MEDFRKKDLHVLHFNANSLLPKVDDIRYFAISQNFFKQRTRY